ncbi:class I adenylate-forming enzyme family protein [Nocardioides daejeonensis]|uniref:class I adenylate-forming enzyme family protein n=1 Tax=Nocardioides daejeonensis TaxID=1046556 RepID=UPI000D742DD5|nr:AMP-binding protein [Nocardioides daejeonensis]
MTATIGAALSWWARTQPEAPAYVFADETLDYRTVEHWSSRVARLLGEHGVAPGDRVGLMAGNSVPWPIAALGVMKAGGVLVPLNPRFKPAELRKVLDDAGAAVVIADDAFVPTVTAAGELGAATTAVSFADLRGARAGAPDTFRIDRGEEDPIAVIFTSGSTGMAKGVVLTNRTLMSIVFEASLTEEGFHRGSTSILVLPLAFTPGLVWGVLMTTVLGGKIVIEADLNPGRAVKLIEEHQVEAIFGVPLIYQALAAAPEFAEADLSSLKTAAVGGAAVPATLLEAWAAKDVALRQIYGMTEAGGIATSTWVSEYREHPGTCGSGLIFTRVKTVREDGSDCEPGELGELVIQGPGVTPGYWEAPQINAEVFRDGWLHSGDLGTLDEQGRVKFVDRLKDLIITGGINVSPVELELVVAGIPGVAECSVIAAPDPKFGETPAAIITVNGELAEQTVVEECAKVLADYKVPRYVVLRQDPLPRLPNGKISKTEIRAEYADIADKFAKVR